MAKKDNKNLFNILGNVDELMSMKETLDEGKAASLPSAKEVEVISSVDGELIDIELKDLVEYHSHTFKVLDNEDMDRLVESIRDFGMLLPILVREIPGRKYEVLSGHRRRFAAEKLGLEYVTCKVLDVSDDMADIVMTDTNLAREKILPSEKAHTYKVRLDAVKRLGKTITGEIKDLAEKGTDTVSAIQDYIKLCDLNDELLELVDEEKMSVAAGVSLSTLNKKHQGIVSELISAGVECPTLEIANNLRNAAKSSRGLSRDRAEDIMKGNVKTKKPKSKKAASITEKMFEDLLPSDVRKLSIEGRLAYVREAITKYSSEN